MNVLALFFYQTMSYSGLILEGDWKSVDFFFFFLNTKSRQVIPGLLTQKK